VICRRKAADDFPGSILALHAATDVWEYLL